MCTAGELAVALAAEFPAERIGVHGNNKSVDELRQAVAAGVGSIVVDSSTEIARLNEVARATGVRQSVLVRVTVGVEAHTHEFIATAQKIRSSACAGRGRGGCHRRCAIGRLLELVGLHPHIGSQIRHQFEVAAHRVVELAARVKDGYGVEPAEPNLGGGRTPCQRRAIQIPGASPTGCGRSCIVNAMLLAYDCRGSALNLPAIVGPSGDRLRGRHRKDVRLDGGLTRPTYPSTAG